MVKRTHEIRDPVHQFIRIDNRERRAIDSVPVQRLRQIHQLAMTYLVYPGATHRRFEHALGVMELAGRVFDVITNPENLHPAISEAIQEIGDGNWLPYWRQTLRMAALCHDLGHIPFSHAAERELLPTGWSHERLSVELICSEMMADVWKQSSPKLEANQIAKIAVGRKEWKGDEFSIWEAILSEIVVSDTFGVDRMDYLLRDSLHCGVAYGRFDHVRLIDTLRVLPQGDDLGEPALGVEEGGLHAAESLLVARYLMFSQVYFHRVRRAYDVHLRDFLKLWLSAGSYSVEMNDHLNMIDDRVMLGIAECASDEARPAHGPARRIKNREHFRVLWSHNPADVQTNHDAGRLIWDAAREKYGEMALQHDEYKPSGAVTDFPVLMTNGQVESGLATSRVLNTIPPTAFEFVFVDPSLVEESRLWLRDNKSHIISD